MSYNKLHSYDFSLMIKQTELKITSDCSKESPLDIELALGLVDLTEVIVQGVRNIEYCKVSCSFCYNEFK